MKKLFTVLLTMIMVLALVGCGAKTNDEPVVEDTPTTDEELVDPPVTAKNTYADFEAAELNTELELLMSVQATESWWDGKITVYGQDDDGGYLVYELACPEQKDADVLLPGTLIRVKGYKSEWSGEVELTDATYEFVDVGGNAGKVYDPVDLTDLIGNNDELIKHMNQKASFKNLTVVEYTEVTSDADGYLVVKDANGTEITFVVRRYLTSPESDLAKTVAAFAAGDVVDLTTFVYWYEGPQARIIEAAKH